MPQENVKIDTDKEKHTIDEGKVIQTIIFGSDWQEVLTTLVSEEGMDPLDVDLIKLADSFLSYLQRLESFDFRVPARFVLIAAILLRMKTELLLEEEEKKQLRESEQITPINIDEIPALTPPIVRVPTKKVTLDDLISALNKAFAFKEKKEVKNIRMKKAVEKLIEPSEDIETRIQRIYDVILKSQKLTFAQLVPRWNRKEIIETLMPLLHLSQRHKVTLEQKEMFSDIEILILEMPSDGEAVQQRSSS